MNCILFPLCWCILLSMDWLMQSPQEHNLRAFYLLEWLQFRTLVFVPYCACWLDETSDSRKIRHLVTVSSLIGFKEIFLEKHEAQPSASSTSLVFLKITTCLYNSTMHSDTFFISLIMNSNWPVTARAFYKTWWKRTICICIRENLLQFISIGWLSVYALS